MTIWVDADACPVAVKTILFRAADRAEITTLLVANQGLPLPPSKWVSLRLVERTFDAADDYIAAQVEAGDLVITGDIPLAARVIAAKAEAISPRGERFDVNNIQSRLGMRNFMEELRSAGVQTGGSAPFAAADKQRFANALDSYLNRMRGKK